MSTRREVWKIGGSVLKDSTDYENFAARINERAVDPTLDRLYVVVSAAKGISDSLIDDLPVTAEELKRIRAQLNGKEAGDLQPLSIGESDIAALLLWGEIDSCHRLRNALLKRGGRAKTVTQLDYYPIIAIGSRLCADVDLAASEERFGQFETICEHRKIVIISGFGAVDRNGDPVLLGRNSTDYIAAELTRLDRHVQRALFIKESGGLYAEYGSPNRRLIDDIHISGIPEHNNSGLLDRRCIDVIDCDFQIVGRDLEVGTLVRCRPRRAAS